MVLSPSYRFPSVHQDADRWQAPAVDRRHVDADVEAEAQWLAEAAGKKSIEHADSRKNRETKAAQIIRPGSGIFMCVTAQEVVTHEFSPLVTCNSEHFKLARESATDHGVLRRHAPAL